MNEELRETIRNVRAALAGIPDAYTFADFPPGATVDSDLPNSLRELLQVTNGPRAGDVVIFSAAELPNNQFYCDDLEGGAGRWLCFGTNLDYPLLLERDTEMVWWFPEMDYEYHFMSDHIERLADGIDSFVAEYVLGPGYARLTDGAQDDWQEFLRAQGLTS